MDINCVLLADMKLYFLTLLVSAVIISKITTQKGHLLTVMMLSRCSSVYTDEPKHPWLLIQVSLFANPR